MLQDGQEWQEALRSDDVRLDCAFGVTSKLLRLLRQIGTKMI